jgi:hypothetical protein
VLPDYKIRSTNLKKQNSRSTFIPYVALSTVRYQNCLRISRKNVYSIILGVLTAL